MTDLTELQCHLLTAALRARGCITVVLSEDGNLSVRVGSERVCGSAAPLEGLVAAQLLKLIGNYEDRKAPCPEGEIRGVRLYELTSAGRAVALEVEVGPRAANGGESLGRSKPKESEK